MYTPKQYMYITYYGSKPEEYKDNGYITCTIGYSSKS